MPYESIFRSKITDYSHQTRLPVEDAGVPKDFPSPPEVPPELREKDDDDYSATPAVPLDPRGDPPSDGEAIPVKATPSRTLDDFADKLQDSFDDPPQKVIDIDRMMAEKQGLTGTLDPYTDPKGVIAARQAELRPFIDQYAKYRDIASMWGLNMNGYRFPRDMPDEEIQSFLDRMYADLQQRIARKKRFGW